jgi:hypothetical protein
LSLSFVETRTFGNISLDAEVQQGHLYHMSTTIRETAVNPRFGVIGIEKKYA